MMKKIMIYFSFLLLLFTFFKCSVENSVSKNERIDMEAYLTEFNAAKMKSQQGILLRGKVLFDVIDDKKAILVIEDDSNSEHAVYYYQSDDEELPNIELGSCSVLFLKTSIYIQDLLTNDVYKVALEDDTSNPFQNVFFTSSIKAFGVGATKGRVQQQDQRFNDQISLGGSCGCKRNGINHGCSSGGVGAISCTCCGCSVTCGTGFYACCN